MTDWLNELLILWQLLLMLVLALHMLKADSTLQRCIALSPQGLIVIAVLALLAARRGEAGYLDIALVIALLGAAQIIAIVRTIGKHKDMQ